MIDVRSLAFLASDDGRALLAEEAGVHEDALRRITRLRKRWPAEIAAAVVDTLELRRKAAPKFSHAGEMLFTREGLEQSSGEITAAWRAERFPAGARILDLCCGIGGDAALLSQAGEVTAFDLQPAHAFCARHNARVYGGQVAVACANATRLRLEADAALLDPSRRRGGRRVRDAEAFSPPLSFVAELQRAIPNLAVKLSPAMDDDVLQSFGGRVEFVSDRGECKEAVVWLCELGPSSARSAAILPAGVALTADPSAPPPAIDDPRSFLLEPDPAVIRAHLVAEAAAPFAGAQLDAGVAWLTADEPVASPLVTCYRVVDWLPFNLANIQRRLRALGAHAAAVKTRGVPMTVEEIQPRLKRAGDRPLTVVLTRVRGAPAAILAERFTPPGA